MATVRVIILNDIALKLEQVSVKRKGSDRAQMDGVSATIRKGELIALCGPNGAGKSTLARVILGLYPISTGRIFYGEYGELQSTNLSCPVRMVFQPAIAQIVGDTVFEELSITLLQRHPSLTRHALDIEVAHLCRRVGLSASADTRVRSLSTGQLHRLCIAEALASEASVIIVDEGLSSLDSTSKKQMMQQFEALAESGTSIIVVTHDMENVLLAHRVLVMQDGQLTADVPPANFFYSDDGMTSPCVSLGMTPPYVVQTALAWNRLTQTGVRRQGAIKPLGEIEFVEAIRRANAT